MTPIYVHISSNPQPYFLHALPPALSWLWSRHVHHAHSHAKSHLTLLSGKWPPNKSCAGSNTKCLQVVEMPSCKQPQYQRTALNELQVISLNPKTLGGVLPLLFDIDALRSRRGSGCVVYMRNEINGF